MPGKRKRPPISLRSLAVLHRRRLLLLEAELRQELPPKLSGDIANVTFDFTSRLGASETISTQSVAASVYSGTDATPSGLISGAATASGAVVTQKLTGGVVGVIYELLCTITTSAGQTLVMSALLAVVPDLP